MNLEVKNVRLKMEKKMSYKVQKKVNIINLNNIFRGHNCCSPNRLCLYCRCTKLKMKAMLSPLCRDIASDRRELAKLGITHILNCAQSKWRGGAEYYAGMNITYHGIEAHDSPTFDMSVNFYPAAEFIHKALTSGGESRIHT